MRQNPSHLECDFDAEVHHQNVNIGCPGERFLGQPSNDALGDMETIVESLTRIETEPTHSCNISTSCRKIRHAKGYFAPEFQIF